MEKSTTIGALAAALAKAQGEFPHVPMNAKNSHLGNKYADLGDVIQTAKPILTKNSLSVSQTVFGGEGLVGVSTILMHSSGEWLSDAVTMPIWDQKGLQAIQVAGSAISYLRRYSYASILGMYADEDMDGDTSGKPVERTNQQTPAMKPALQRAPASDRPAPVAADAPAPNGKAGLMDPEQKKRIWNVAHAGMGWDVAKLQELVSGSFDGKKLAGLTKTEADQLLGLLGELMDAQAKGATA